MAEIERVAVNRPVDAPVAVRHEGDVTIIPVLAERIVTRTQLVLVEEIRITRHRETRPAPRQVTLRREEMVVERLDAASGEWRVVDAAPPGLLGARAPAESWMRGRRRQPERRRRDPGVAAAQAVRPSPRRCLRSEAASRAGRTVPRTSSGVSRRAGIRRSRPPPRGPGRPGSPCVAASPSAPAPAHRARFAARR